MWGQDLEDVNCTAHSTISHIQWDVSTENDIIRELDTNLLVNKSDNRTCANVVEATTNDDDGVLTLTLHFENFTCNAESFVVHFYGYMRGEERTEIVECAHVFNIGILFGHVAEGER